MFALYSLKHVVSHVSPGAEEGCCVTCFVCSRRSMLCHMFRLGLKKAVVSHVSFGAEKGCCVTCFVCSRRIVTPGQEWSVWGNFLEDPFCGTFLGEQTQKENLRHKKQTQKHKQEGKPKQEQNKNKNQNKSKNKNNTTKQTTTEQNKARRFCSQVTKSPVQDSRASERC